MLGYLMLPGRTVIHVGVGSCINLGREHCHPDKNALHVSKIQCQIIGAEEKGLRKAIIMSKSQRNPTLLLRRNSVTTSEVFLHKGEEAEMQDGDHICLLATNRNQAIIFRSGVPTGTPAGTASPGCQAPASASDATPQQGFSSLGIPASCSFNVDPAHAIFHSDTLPVSSSGDTPASADAEHAGAPSSGAAVPFDHPPLKRVRLQDAEASRSTAARLEDRTEREQRAEQGTPTLLPPPANREALISPPELRDVVNEALYASPAVRGAVPLPEADSGTVQGSGQDECTASNVPPVMVLTVGLPGAGKSSWCSELLKMSPARWVRINQDTIRPSKRRGSKGECVQAAKKALQDGKSVVIDRLNYDVDQRSSFTELAIALGVQAHAVVFSMPTSLCLARAMNRKNHEGGVDKRSAPAIIQKIARLLRLPSAAEPFSSIMVCKSIAEVNAALTAWGAYGTSTREPITLFESLRGPSDQNGIARFLKPRGAGGGTQAVASQDTLGGANAQDPLLSPQWWTRPGHPLGTDASKAMPVVNSGLPDQALFSGRKPVEAHDALGLPKKAATGC
eukprot:jgi/Botrbrau1/21795/Bobra.0190s0020.1